MSEDCGHTVNNDANRRHDKGDRETCVGKADSDTCGQQAEADNCNVRNENQSFSGRLWVDV